MFQGLGRNFPDFPQFAATVRAGNGRDPGLQAAIAVVVLLAVMGYGCMRLEAV